MKYRRFGKLEWEISEVSLGLLRKEEAIAGLDAVTRPERVKAIRYAIDRGVNYVNMGYPFYFKNPQKECEYVTEALDDGYHNKIKLAINIPARGISSYQDLNKALNEQLRLFDIKKADFCVIDDIDAGTWDKIKSIDMESWVGESISSGIVGQVGIGFHDDPHFLKRILDACRQWAFIQVELSLVDYMHHPGVGCFNYAKEKDIAVIVSDVTKGGRLLKNIPEDILEIIKKSGKKMRQEERYIRWALSFENVSSALMSSYAEFSTVEQIGTYLAYIESFDPVDVDMWEMLEATKIREAYYAIRDCLCTTCRCCMPCPHGIDAPRIIELINEEKMFSDEGIPKLQYNLENHKKSKCTQCGICVKQCKKHFPIDEIVKKACEKYAQ